MLSGGDEGSEEDLGERTRGAEERDILEVEESSFVDVGDVLVEREIIIRKVVTVKGVQQGGVFDSQVKVGNCLGASHCILMLCTQNNNTGDFFNVAFNGSLTAFSYEKV